MLLTSIAADAIRLCDEDREMEIDHDEMLAPGDVGSTPTDDFGELIVSDCFILQIVYSTTSVYRTNLGDGTPPTNVCAVFDTETNPA